MRTTFLPACLGLIAVSCATTPSHSPLEPASPKPVVEDAGAADAAGGRAVQAGGERDQVPMDVRDPNTGVVPAEVARQLHGTHVVPLAWEPWWSAAPSANGPLGALTVEIAMLGPARNQEGDIALDAKVRLRDAKEVLALERQVTFLIHDRLLIFANIELDDPALAKRLGLPKPADASKAADPFELVLSLRDRKLLVWVASTRAGNRCALAHGAKPARSECEKRFGHRIMAETAVFEERSLRAQLVPGFAPHDALAALASQQLNVRWPDGKPSRLHVQYEPEERVCVLEEEQGGYRVVIPLHAMLSSEDGRLAARFGGFAETRVARDGSWDRSVEAALDYALVTPLKRDEHRGLDLPDSATGLLSTTLRTPAAELELSGLGLHVCQPFDGAPPYPDVADGESKRMSCLCASELGSQAASIWRTPPAEAKDREPLKIRDDLRKRVK